MPQVLYSAFMLARDTHAPAAEQRACRESGLHMAWAPSSHRHDEASDAYRPAPLTPFGAALYGYREPKGARARGAAAEATRGTVDGPPAPDWEAAAPLSGGLTAAHVAFFERYGYVVVEQAAPLELVARVIAEVRTRPQLARPTVPISRAGLAPARTGERAPALALRHRRGRPGVDAHLAASDARLLARRLGFDRGVLAPRDGRGAHASVQASPVTHFIR